jgi:hypothetical protein
MREANGPVRLVQRAELPFPEPLTLGSIVRVGDGSEAWMAWVCGILLPDDGGGGLLIELLPVG